MSKLLAIARNDIRIEFADRSTLVFFLILPIIFTVITGIGGGGSGSAADERYPVLVLDRDGGPLAARLVSVLAASEVARPESVAEADVQRLLEQRLAAALVTIPAGFSDSLLAGRPAEVEVRRILRDTSVLAVEQAVGAATGAVSDAVAAALASVAEAERVKPFADEAARAAYFRQSLDQAQTLLEQPAVTVATTQAPRSQPPVAMGFSQSSPGQLVTWVMITLLGGAEVFVSERLGGTLRRLMVTPTRRATILGGKVLGRLGMGLVQMALLIGFGAVVLGVNWGRSPLALALVALSFALAAVALGILLATFARTRSQAGWFAVFFAMLMAALGGAWWPLEVTPAAYQAAVRVLPSTWAMQGFSDVVVRGLGVSAIAPEVAVLLGFAAVFFVIGALRFRFE